MRTERAIKNIMVSMTSYVILLIIGFIMQRIFKDVLGAEYLGINSLFSNIITGLNVVELGFGTAIIANMYKPVAENDYEKINALLQHYKKIYRYMALIILMIGVGILPFINIIVGNTTISLNFRVVFILYLLDCVVSYLMTYKRSILYANQQTYYTTLIHTGVLLTTYFFQIFFLIETHNFYIYLVTSIFFRIVENLAINKITDIKFPYIGDKKKYDIDSYTKQDIRKKVKGLIFHKIASFVVFGTDNIIISMVPNLGIYWVGIYSNYSLITTKLTSLIDNIFNSITASIGNLLVENDKDKSYIMFRNLKFINTWIYVFFSISFYVVSFPFVKLWMGKTYVLDDITVLIISLNLFIGGLRASYGAFKNAAGIFYEDRFVPIAESVVNIVFSIPFAFLWGLKGVLIGTICSTLVLFIFSYPRFVYNKIFDKGIILYWKDFFESVINFFICMFVTCKINQIILFDNDMVELIKSIVVCCIVPNLIMIVIYRKKKEYLYFVNMIKNIFKSKHFMV